MAGGNRRKVGRWTGAVLLVVAASFLLARTIPSGDAGAAGPDLDADLPTYGPEEAAGHLGETARVCGIVRSASYLPEVGGRPTFLNLGRPYPDQPFTVVIWGEDRARFDTPERRLQGRRICAAGRIRSHEGTPQIEVRRPDQIGVRAGNGPWRSERKPRSPKRSPGGGK